MRIGNKGDRTHIVLAPLNLGRLVCDEEGRPSVGLLTGNQDFAQMSRSSDFFQMMA
jgi:hypothetical protein